MMQGSCKLGADSDKDATHEVGMQVKEWRRGGNQSIITPLPQTVLKICQATTHLDEKQMLTGYIAPPSAAEGIKLIGSLNF
ncbi:hypothetical protein PHISCL_07118 [Aspergillus sclerotialis]|uniref:Uncharacterized protein n=1 Tax=Aspergillus sclerotialis TaxID=2070753 RepID=A0A3A2ZBQ2_9EURO|nr:hypothetical protein PHISCL_07118 [Aspergillus sclerotialis]